MDAQSYRFAMSAAAVDRTPIDTERNRHAQLTEKESEILSTKCKRTELMLNLNANKSTRKSEASSKCTRSEREK